MNRAKGLFTKELADLVEDWPGDEIILEDDETPPQSASEPTVDTPQETRRENVISGAEPENAPPPPIEGAERGFREVVVDIDASGSIPGTDRVVALSAIELIDGAPSGKAFTAKTRRQGGAGKKLLLPEAVSDFLKFIGNDRVILHDADVLGFLDDELTKFGYRPLTFSHAVVSTRQVASKLWSPSDVDRRLAVAPGDSEAHLRAPRVARLYSALTDELDAAREDFERVTKRPASGEALLIQAPDKWRPTVPSLGSSGKRQRVDLDAFETAKGEKPEQVDYFWKDRRRYKASPVSLFSQTPSSIAVSKAGAVERDAVAAALQVAADKFGPLLKLDGDDAFIAAAIDEIARRDMPISLRNVRQQERLNEARRDWARRREAERLAEIAADSALRTEKLELIAGALREWGKEFDPAEIHFNDPEISPDEFREWAASGAQRLVAILSEIEKAFEPGSDIDQAVRANLNVARTTVPGAKEVAVSIALNAARDKLTEQCLVIDQRLQMLTAQAVTKPHEVAPPPSASNLSV